MLVEELVVHETGTCPCRETEGGPVTLDGRLTYDWDELRGCRLCQLSVTRRRIWQWLRSGLLEIQDQLTSDKSMQSLPVPRSVITIPISICPSHPQADGSAGLICLHAQRLICFAKGTPAAVGDVAGQGRPPPETLSSAALVTS